MFNEGRKNESSKVIQTNKAKQHNTPKAPKKNELYTSLHVHVYTCFNER